MKIKNFLLIALVMATLVGVSGCYTMEGLGKDIHRVATPNEND